MKMVELSAQRFNNIVDDSGWLAKNQANVLFDGQFGSTGKGLLAAYLAHAMAGYMDVVATNAGPNSGHTAYLNGEKIMTQQLPVAAVVSAKMGVHVVCYLNGGAVIDMDILEDEISRYGDGMTVLVHPHAAVISDENKGVKLSHIASTGKGVGPAMASKLLRGPGTVWRDQKRTIKGTTTGAVPPEFLGNCLLETAQGWSLGINSGFYPYTTSRECSVSQALADMGLSPRDFGKSIVSLRTYPIRVGNTPDGFSGPCYPDQIETSFDKLQVEPELTTVTKRVRRIFTWSDIQYEKMLLANHPDALFFNFCNYIDDWVPFVEDKVKKYFDVMGHRPDFVLTGHSEKTEDIRAWGVLGGK